MTADKSAGEYMATGNAPNRGRDTAQQAQVEEHVWAEGPYWNHEVRAAAGCAVEA